MSDVDAAADRAPEERGERGEHAFAEERELRGSREGHGFRRNRGERRTDARGPGGVISDAPRQVEPVDVRNLPPEAVREFEVAGVRWLAVIAGEAMGGTGMSGGAHFVAVHFYRADAPERPEREALASARRFEFLYDEELGELLARGKRIEFPE